MLCTEQTGAGGLPLTTNRTVSTLLRRSKPLLVGGGLLHSGTSTWSHCFYLSLSRYLRPAEPLLGNRPMILSSPCTAVGAAADGVQRLKSSGNGLVQPVPIIIRQTQDSIGELVVVVSRP